MLHKRKELLEEIQSVLGGRIADAVIPPLAFLIINGLWDFRAAMFVSLGLSVILGVRRVWRGESLAFSALGILSVLLAIGLVRLLGREEGFFIPGLVSSGVTLGLSVLSLLLRRPLTAWSSFIARRWELGWYWHPRVRPAYTETTLLWTLFFALKFWLQLTLFQGKQADSLAWAQALSGFPALLVLLILTYLYGTWRLKNLEGPSVEEYKTNTPPPWQGQRRGF